MRGRFLFPSLIAAAAACSGAPADDPGAGHLVLERTAPTSEVLLDAVASARYCERDSVLTILGIGDRWSAVIGMRTAWPPAREYRADTIVGELGTAAFAARMVGDSADPALRSSSGRVELDSGEVLSGRFTVEWGSDSSAMTLAGRFQGLRRDSIGCASGT
jgi:hypothetical protein